MRGEGEVEGGRGESGGRGKWNEGERGRGEGGGEGGGKERMKGEEDRI